MCREFPKHRRKWALLLTGRKSVRLVVDCYNAMNPIPYGRTK